MAITKCCKYIISSVLWTPDREERSGRESSIFRTGPIATSLPEKGASPELAMGSKRKRGTFDCEMDVLSEIPPSMFLGHALLSHSSGGPCMDVQSIPSFCIWAAGCSGRACLLHPCCHNTPRRRHLFCSLEIVFLLMKTIKKDPLLLDGCGAGL